MQVDAARAGVVLARQDVELVVVLTRVFPIAGAVVARVEDGEARRRGGGGGGGSCEWQAGVWRRRRIGCRGAHG